MAFTNIPPLDQYGRGFKGYWFPYQGYGPSIMAGESTCDFMPQLQSVLFTQHQLKENLWFEPNVFGGACKYLFLLGCLLDKDFGDDSDEYCQVTMVKKFERASPDAEDDGSPLSLSLAKSTLALLALFVS